MTRRLAREEGLLVGISSGAAMAAALRVASGITHGVIVTIFGDSGDKYLSERFWDWRGSRQVNRRMSRESTARLGRTHAMDGVQAV